MAIIWRLYRTISLSQVNAQVGSATVVGLGEVIGKFEIGFEFDAIKVECNLGDHEGPWDFFPEDSPETLFEKWVNLGDDRNIKNVWVQGKDVTPAKSNNRVI
jgi:guanine deaminase